MAAFGQVLRLSEIQNNISSGRFEAWVHFLKVSASHWSTHSEVFSNQSKCVIFLSITTVYPSPGKRVWYEDQLQVHNQIFESREAVDYAFMGNRTRMPPTIVGSVKPSKTGSR